MHQILVHMIGETSRHAGHADIVRELLDVRAGNDDGNLPSQTDEDWASHRIRLEQTAEAAGGSAG